jgi:16S rRNA (uracil1498-N3)-methyltransferase
MTHRRFYAPSDAFAPDAQSVTLGVDETNHLRNVLRLTVGDEAHVFDGEGREFRCAIAKVDHMSTRMTVIEEIDAPRESLLNLTLAVALLKGEKFDLVVQKATELGVNQIIPIITSRADVKINSDADAEKKRARWQRIALEATKQCGRARLMKVDAPLSFAELIDQGGQADGTRLMFAERAGHSFENTLNALPEPPRKVIALIGSEGGFSDAEIGHAGSVGWQIVTLGGRIMRAETAAIAIAALLQHRFGDLK